MRKTSLSLPFNSFAWLTVAACSWIAGCGGVRSDRPETAPVRGHVSYRGKPLADARVVFIRSGTPRFASGQTDAAGKFQLTTFSPGDGAAIGENIVTVTKHERAANASATRVDPASRDASAMDAAFDRAAKSAPARSAIPMKYSSQKTSELKRDVVAGENNFEIELVD